jgi:hypothetical protein
VADVLPQQVLTVERQLRDIEMRVEKLERFAAPSGGPRAPQRYPDDYGAVGDGTLETAQLQATFDAAGVNGIVELQPNKNYLHGHITPPAGMTLILNGSTLKRGATGVGLDLSANGVTVVGPGKIDANGANFQGDGIVTNGTNNFIGDVEGIAAAAVTGASPAAAAEIRQTGGTLSLRRVNLHDGVGALNTFGILVDGGTLTMHAGCKSYGHDADNVRLNEGAGAGQFIHLEHSGLALRAGVSIRGGSGTVIVDESDDDTIAAVDVRYPAQNWDVFVKGKNGGVTYGAGAKGIVSQVLGGRNIRIHRAEGQDCNGYVHDVGALVNYKSTTLNGAIDASQTTIPVIDRTKLPTVYPYEMQCEWETMLATGNGGGANEVVVVRGTARTNAATHASGKTVGDVHRSADVHCFFMFSQNCGDPAFTFNGGVKNCGISQWVVDGGTYAGIVGESRADTTGNTQSPRDNTSVHTGIGHAIGLTHGVLIFDAAQHCSSGKITSYDCRTVQPDVDGAKGLLEFVTANTLDIEVEGIYPRDSGIDLATVPRSIIHVDSAAHDIRVLDGYDRDCYGPPIEDVNPTGNNRFLLRRPRRRTGGSFTNRIFSFDSGEAWSGAHVTNQTTAGRFIEGNGGKRMQGTTPNTSMQSTLSSLSLDLSAMAGEEWFECWVYVENASDIGSSGPTLRFQTASGRYFQAAVPIDAFLRSGVGQWIRWRKGQFTKTGSPDPDWAAITSASIFVRSGAGGTFALSFDDLHANLNAFDAQLSGAANPDTTGLTLANLEIEVNELKQLLRDVGHMAP